MSPSPNLHPVSADRSPCAGEQPRPAPVHSRLPWVWWGAVLLFDLGALALLVDHRPLAALVVFLVPMPCLLPPLVVPSSAGFGPVVTRFSTERREVWLTIDDGPDPVTTPPVLALLDDYMVAESGGPGTGYDTIILNIAPLSNDHLFADYILAFS